MTICNDCFCHTIMIVLETGVGRVSQFFKMGKQKGSNGRRRWKQRTGGVCSTHTRLAPKLMDDDVLRQLFRNVLDGTWPREEGDLPEHTRTLYTSAMRGLRSRHAEKGRKLLADLFAATTDKKYKSLQEQSLELLKELEAPK